MAPVRQMVGVQSTKTPLFISSTELIGLFRGSVGTLTEIKFCDDDSWGKNVREAIFDAHILITLEMFYFT